MRKLVTILAILTAASAQARLGETWDECIQRYGPPQKTGEKLTRGIDLITGPEASATFKQEDFRISVAWLPPRGADGWAAAIAIHGKSFTDAQVKAFLQANSQGRAWGTPPPEWARGPIQEVPTFKLTARSWIWREDGARAIQGFGLVTIESPEVAKMAIMKELQAKRDREKIPNF